MAVVVVELVERVVPTPEVRNSNPVISKKLYWTFTVDCTEKMIIKKKEAGIGSFLFMIISKINYWTMLNRSQNVTLITYDNTSEDFPAPGTGTRLTGSNRASSLSRRCRRHHRGRGTSPCPRRGRYRTSAFPWSARRCGCTSWRGWPRLRRQSRCWEGPNPLNPDLKLFKLQTEGPVPQTSDL